MEYNVWFESKTALRVIRELASEAQHSARFGIGFFTIRGWDLVRNFLENRQVLLLVGEVEPSAKQAKKLLIDKILADLTTGTFVNRYQTVRDILERIEGGQLGIFDARSLRHHAKVYIFDEKIAVVGSSNLTVNGLTQQIEAGAIVKNPKDLRALSQKFNEYFDKAEDLTEKIREILTNWLKMSRLRT
ncbi:MAG: phospholipase D-like domain-containing protein [Limnoraphis robusta]|jgi:phosphatidylserine/phosphatidylglycerophosphate/cardiolipin synthase-like enzyme